MRAPEICPACGAEVPNGARSCPECGSDESTGWSDRAQAQSLDLPDDEFNYDEFVKREFGHKKPKLHVHWIWWVTAVALLALFAWFFFKR